MTPAEVALNQFQLRRAWLARSGKPVSEQDAKLRPWAAIALRAGAPLDQLPRDVQASIVDYRQAFLSEAHARALVAEELCPRAKALAELARARDRLFDTLADDTDEARITQARDLQALAAFLHASPYNPAPAPAEAQPQQEAA